MSGARMWSAADSMFLKVEIYCFILKNISWFAYFCLKILIADENANIVQVERYV